MTTNNSNTKSDKMYDIKEFAKELGLSEVYVRRMILTKKISTVKVHVSENVWKHMIDQETVDRMKTKLSTGKHGTGKREDGRNKFNIYLTPEEQKKLQELLKSNEFQVPVSRANVKKVS